VTYNAGSSTGAHTITVAPGTTENTYIALSSTGVTVEGAADTNGRADGIQVNATVNVNDLSSTFGTVTGNHLTMTTSFGTTVMSEVEYVQFNNAKVLLVGAGGYASLTEASAAAHSGDVIYVTDAALASGTNGVINHTDISIYIASGDGANMSMAPGGMEVRIYGIHSFNLTGSSGNDTIHDYTNIAAGLTNTISGGDGNDSIVAHNNTLGTEILQGDGGSDILIGGTNAQLLGGDGADILLALGGSAYLSGGAGNDVLLNAYASTDATAKAVTLIGGAGSDVFGLIGTNNAAATGAMKTTVADLGTGDSIDLSFLEKIGTNTSITSTADLGAAANGGTSLAKMTTAGTTLDLKTFNATSSEASTDTTTVTDVNSQVTGGSMSIANATLTKASTAITAGMLAESSIDFNSTFGHLTDTYVQH
jgi:Ca2+-binding RTX toxin-like protein